MGREEGPEEERMVVRSRDECFAVGRHELVVAREGEGLSCWGRQRLSEQMSRCRERGR